MGAASALWLALFASVAVLPNVTGAYTIDVSNTGSTGADGVSALGLVLSNPGNGGASPSFSQSISGSDTGVRLQGTGGVGGGGVDGVIGLFPNPPNPLPELRLLNGLPGGTGGSGGTQAVTVNSGGQSQTTANQTHAVSVSATGGQGGTGGGGFSFTLLTDSFGTNGGDGGTGGAGGAVTVTNNGTLRAAGTEAVGIFARSRGGAGGAGGTAGAFLSAGGAGGRAGDGGVVTVSNTQTIATTGEAGRGILAQSYGGDGAGGGGSVGLFFSQGGDAGTAGTGGDVFVTNAGQLSTQGRVATGILAQSIGGGGGAGGVGVAISSLGGTGSVGGSSRNVRVTNTATGTITTLGDGANGILGQSMAGGGGDAGVAVGLVAIGGSGSGGGNGSTVVLSNAGTITTAGNSASAIKAQSIGGGGGNGGVSVGLVGVGGRGGAAGNGGFAGIHQTGTVRTSGASASAVVAQSIGGGGGDGGVGVGIGIGPAAASVAVGGTGGAAGAGGTVRINEGMTDGSAGGLIETTGRGSSGVIAQSVGGGGGLGGFAGSFSLASTASVSVAVGGAGGAGGNGGSVDARLAGSVSTLGADALGLLAQSLGGGGGHGAFALAVSGSGGASAAIAVGQAGGNGGAGGSVLTRNWATISTSGDRSVGLLAQSIGGGGGNAGYAVSASGAQRFSGSVSIGASGGAGGVGGTVDVDNRAAITTQGGHATAIHAQSIGGGGGRGGFGIAAALSGSLATSLSVGGSGGAGRNAGAVTVQNVAALETAGPFAHGIGAQSIGGSGGSGGFAVSGGAAAGGAGAVGVSIGGLGGGGDFGGAVTVENTGSILTKGSKSTAILAQSVGGGGGNGGFSVSAALTLRGTTGLSTAVGGSGGAGSNGGTVVLNSNPLVAPAGTSASIETRGIDSIGLHAQSVGGGGGNGGFAVSGAGAILVGGTENRFVASVAVGGTAGGGGTGGAVTVATLDRILTSGQGSTGLLAQSIGGGGGYGGFGASLGSSGTSSTSATATVAIGGTGGTGAVGGAVSVTAGGSIETHGAYATAVQAQSIGGGGGMGGFGAGVATGLGANALQATVSVGGTGGTGNSGGAVTVTQTGQIRTLGAVSWGILAQSIGGGGGNGALALSGAIGGQNAKNATATIGGSGASGSHGGDVTVTNSGSIRTEGDASFAIYAQSVGGGGGTGGSAGALVGGATGAGVGKNINLASTIGGSGGNGSNGGVVTLTNSAALTTLGDAAVGIYAQSLGGGGGDGGASLNGLVGLVGGAEGKTINSSVSIGGSGGTGQDGGAVTVTNSGAITTAGADAQGIRAQSIGGGGGSGGRAGSLSLIQGKPKPGCNLTLNFACAAPATLENSNINLQLLIGGTGGSGNDGGTVTVDNTGAVTTTGPAAHGIQAQSIGAGGGAAGNAILGLPTKLPTVASLLSTAAIGFTSKQGELANHAVSIGGKGGATGDGGRVAVTNGAALTVSGEDSIGVLAQSIGGGGGIGGLANTGRTGTFSVGGEGGSAGNGGAVEVHLSALSSISTSGDGGHGVFAQSIGGGGGIGGGGQAGRFIGGGHARPNPTPTTFAVSYLQVAIAGSGGPSGNGGAVTVDNRGGVTTTGADASGIVAQSVGGGGGSAGGRASATFTLGGTGGAQGDGGAVTVFNGGAISVAGVRASGIEAQSIGGGGGRGGQAGATAVLPSETQAVVLPGLLSFGGTGGAAGDGGAVAVTNAGQITVRGQHSYGILAQSVGGGGGLGGDTFSLLTLGGGAGVSGNGGDVTVTGNTGAVIDTYADYSIGILAQSVGGGGGSTGLAAGAIAIGGATNTSGRGGAVHVRGETDITTRGLRSYGILAQSIGGGGGNSVGTVSTLSASGPGGAGSDGDVVRVETAGTITTTGAGAHGIVAQSIGGGGGLVTSNDTTTVFNFAGSVGGKGSGRAVVVENTGTISATGTGSIGILAQSDGEGPNGDIDILNSGAGASITGGASGGAAISVLDGRNNQIRNFGRLGNAGGITEAVVLGGTQNETLTNQATGIISGNINLGAGVNSLTNLAGGRLNTGTQLNLGGSTAGVADAGTLAVGGDGTILTTALTGRYDQAATGTLKIDMQNVPLSTAPAQTDVLDVSGTVALEGTVEVTVLNPGQAAPGTHQIEIVRSGGGVNQTVSPNFVAPNSAVAQYQLIRGLDAYRLSYSVDYAPAGLTGAALAFGQYLNEVQLTGGGAGLETIIATLTQPGSTLEALQGTYASLDPQVVSNGVSTSTLTLSDFSRAMRSCPQVGGQDRFIAEGECTWVARLDRTYDVLPDGGFSGAHMDIGQLAFGVQRKAQTGDFWGIGGSVGHANITSGSTYQSSGALYQLGAVLKRQTDNTILSGSFVIGTASFEGRRQVTVGGASAVAHSAQPLRFAQTSVQYAQVFERDLSFVQPKAQVSLTGLQQIGFSETGAGAGNMTFDPRTDWRVDLELGVSAGREFDLPGWDSKLRLHGALGVQHRLLGDAAALSARFAGAGGAAALTTGSGEDATLATVAVGVDLLGGQNGVLRLDASSRFGQRTRDLRAGMKLSLDF